MGAFALVTAGVLAFTNLTTSPKIAIEERKAAQKALLQILPEPTHDNDLLSDTWLIPNDIQTSLNLNGANEVHIARSNGKAVAAILPTVATDGYSGDIKLIVGVWADGTIAGVRTLTHKETPGLGDKVDIKKSNWVLGFNGKSLRNPTKENWTVKKNGGYFDQFTGATITPRAVVNQVKVTLEFFEQNQQSFFLQSDSSQPSKTYSSEPLVEKTL